MAERIRRAKFFAFSLRTASLGALSLWLLAGCAGSTVEFTLAADAELGGDVLVTYEIDGESVSETVTTPWRLPVEVDGRFTIDLRVENLGEDGQVRCGVLTGTDGTISGLGSPSADGQAAAICTVSGSATAGELSTSSETRGVARDNSGDDPTGGSPTDPADEPAEPTDEIVAGGFITVALPPEWTIDDQDDFFEPTSETGPVESIEVNSDELQQLARFIHGTCECADVAIYRSTRPEWLGVHTDPLRQLEPIISEGATEVDSIISSGNIGDRDALSLVGKYSSPDWQVESHVDLLYVGSEVLFVQTRWDPSLPDAEAIGRSALSLRRSLVFDEEFPAPLLHNRATLVSITDDLSKAATLRTPLDWSVELDVQAGYRAQSPDGRQVFTGRFVADVGIDDQITALESDAGIDATNYEIERFVVGLEDLPVATARAVNSDDEVRFFVIVEYDTASFVTVFRDEAFAEGVGDQRFAEAVLDQITIEQP